MEMFFNMLMQNFALELPGFLKTTVLVYMCGFLILKTIAHNLGRI